VYALPAFLGTNRQASVEVMLDHIQYIADLVGWDHVGFGTDWPMQLPKWLAEVVLKPLLLNAGFREEHIGLGNLVGFDDYRDFPNFTRGLVKRGFADQQIKGILGENFLKVFEAVCG
jgi:membrane dipeptidase